MNECPHKALGNRIRALRKARGLSQERLAEGAGLHRTYVGGVERGERNPTLSTMIRIADSLGVSLVDLFEKDCKGSGTCDQN